MHTDIVGKVLSTKLPKELDQLLSNFRIFRVHFMVFMETNGTNVVGSSQEKGLIGLIGLKLTSDILRPPPIASNQ